MCLITRQRKPKILKKDLTVFKIGLKNGIGFFSYIKSFYYAPAVLYTTTLDIINRGVFPGDCFDDTVKNKYNVYMNKHPTLKVISTGYHSSLTKERLAGNSDMAEFLIPAGSEVFYDATGLVVSNQIKFIRNI